MAIQLAGKTAMMMNWTLGPVIFSPILELSVHKWCFFVHFVEHLHYVNFDGADSCFIFVENLKDRCRLWDKMRMHFLNQIDPRQLMARIGVPTLTEESHAVYVFTSGTEGIS